MTPSEVGTGAEPGTPASVDTLLIELSARFISLPSDKVDREIGTAQRQICEALGLDRCTLWQQPSEEPDGLRLTHFYQRPGLPPMPAGAEGKVLFPWTVQRLRRGETIAISRLDDLPPEAASDHECWRQHGTKSTVVVPLSIGGTEFAVLSFASVREPVDWPATLVKRLELFAQVLANAFARARNDSALRETRERYALAVDGANDGLWDWDILTDKVYFSPRWKSMLGYQEHEVANTFSAWEELLHPEDRDLAQATLQAHLAGQSPVFKLEHRLRCKDGGYRWILARGKALRDADGRPYRMAGSHTDITERKLAQEALQHNEERLRLVLEANSEGVWDWNIPSGQAFFSRRYSGMLGYEPEEFPKDYASWKALVHPDDFPRVDQAHAEHIHGSKEFCVELRMRKKSGDWCWILSRGMVVERNAEGRAIRMVGTHLDITERKRAENALRESEERFRQVAEVANDFIWEADAEGLYTYTSPSVQKILGYAPEELVGRLHFYDLFAPETKAALQAAAFEVFACKQTFRDFININVSKDGRLVHLETSGIPLLDEAGNLVGYRGADTDVTERKESEEKLRQAYDEVRRLRDQLQQENVYLRGEVEGLYGHGRLVGQSRALKHVLAQAHQVAPTDSTVLLLGETGTGKELIATAIHDLSPRREKTMVRVNCAAIPASLLESELFGREKGAYTGALSKQVGRFEMADGSTLFLDEIGDLPPEVQVKLLRVLQEKQIERLGSSKTIQVDVRIITATNRDLDKAVREGKFREDLYYRLNVFPITLPPLRERREDIAVLVSAFVEEFATRFGKNIESIDKRSMDALLRYHWPGNVRELRNVIERAMIVAQGPRLWIEPPGGTTSAATRSLTMQEAEHQHIRSILDMTGWRVRGKSGAAEILGLKPSTLESRMAKLGIRRQDRAPTE